MPLEHDQVATFEVTRGTFTTPASMLRDAEAGDDYELRRFFARSLPDQDAVLNTTRQVHRDGSATVTWRQVVTHMRRA